MSSVRRVNRFVEVSSFCCRSYLTHLPNLNSALCPLGAGSQGMFRWEFSSAVDPETLDLCYPCLTADFADFILDWVPNTPKSITATKQKLHFSCHCWVPQMIPRLKLPESPSPHRSTYHSGWPFNSRTTHSTHNAFSIIHLICTPKFCISNVFNFSLGDCFKKKEKLDLNVYSKF